MKLLQLESVARALAARPFVAPPLLRNAHAMTIIGSKRPRRFALLDVPGEVREFATEPGTRVVAHCHWQPDRRSRPTVVVVHGLEGSAQASYVLGTADKALAAGFNVLRCNVRNCGGTAHLTPTLYHSGLTVDLRCIVRELSERDELPEIYLIGFSMGGNQALKLAGELGDDAPPQLRGVCAISPPIDLAACSRAIMRRENFIYEIRFLLSLRRTMRTKAALFPDVYDARHSRGIRHLWDWDETFQPHNGFNGARDYYAQASSLPFIPRIRVPTQIIHAADDPFIPPHSFADERVTSNPAVLVAESRHGGHVAFCGGRPADEDRAWAENRAVEFCRLISQCSTNFSLSEASRRGPLREPATN